jgi:hypothetical protein
MARYESANTIINDTALEVGLVPASDPFSSQDEAYIQLRGLLTSVGRQLVDMHEWQILTGSYEITTADGDTGDYPLPEDFSHMINQTGWNQSTNLPIGGPLSPQDWSYLVGRDLASTTIYASFRLEDGIFRIFPQPPPPDITISFEYASRNWVTESGAQPQAVTTSSSSVGVKDRPDAGTDVILYSPLLVVKFLKMSFLSAKGFDSSAAFAEFQQVFNARTGMDTGSPILSASNRSSGFPYLDGYRNVGDTNFGG